MDDLILDQVLELDSGHQINDYLWNILRHSLIPQLEYQLYSNLKFLISIQTQCELLDLFRNGLIDSLRNALNYRKDLI